MEIEIENNLSSVSISISKVSEISVENSICSSLNSDSNSNSGSNSNSNSKTETESHSKGLNFEITKKYSSFFKVNQIEMFLLDKVEVIYLNMKNETKYHKILKIILFIFSIISYSFLYNYLFMFASNRQNIYCYNTMYKQFEICSRNEACMNYKDGVSIIIYDQSNLSNITDINIEIQNVNQKYQDFFYENSINIFSKITYNRLDPFSEIMKKFNGFVMLTDQEQVNITLKYGDLCNYTTSLIIFGVLIFMGTIFANIFLTICSDILGRKKIFIFSVIFCAVFCFLFFALIVNIDYSIAKIKADFIVNQRQNYSEEYVELIQQLFFNQHSRNIFKDFKIVLALLLFVIHFTNTAAQHSALCLIVENSINDSLVCKNFWFYNNGIILSILYTYITTYPFNEFKYSFLINGIILLIISIFFILYIHESPRQHYEYSEWIPYTQIFDSIIENKKDNIKSLYAPRILYQEAIRIENEILKARQEKVKSSLKLKSKKSSIYEVTKEQLANINENLKKGRTLIIKREELKRNPFIIYLCLIYDKTVQDNNPIIWAYLLIVFLVFNIMNNNFYSLYFFTREGLFAIYFVNSSFFYITLVFLFSNFFFYFFLQIFGFKRVMTFCFICLIFFSLLIDFPLTIVPYYMGYINRYNYNLLTYYFTDNFGKNIRISVYFLSFFQWGIYYTTYIYMFKYTKTIYRCTFFGLIDIINKFSFFGAEFITMYFGRSLLISAISSFMGIFTILFLSDKDEDMNIICDKKKLDVNKKS